MKPVLLALALASLSACSTAPPQVASPPPVAATPRTPEPAVEVTDTCGAQALQGLIGQPRTAIPVPVYPDRQRVACTTCPVTQDFRPDRLNFFFDPQTGRIASIRCG